MPAEKADAVKGAGEAIYKGFKKYNDAVDIINAIEAKLAGIESGATGDQTGAEIKALLEALADKLSIETGVKETTDKKIMTATERTKLGALITDPIGADGTAGRTLRNVYFLIKNGTNANTLKCEMGSRWNGDIIAETDNIAKDATTGNFHLNADGKILTILNTGLTGACQAVLANLYTDGTGTVHTCMGVVSGTGIEVRMRDNGVDQDITALVDLGDMYIDFFYITSA